MDWNYDMESCPLDTKVCLLSSNDCILLPQMEYVGTMTFNGRFKTRGECYEGDKDYFYRSAIVAWKEYEEDKIKEIRRFFEMEMELAEERMKLKHNPMFNGVEVGHENQIELNKAHICYCEYVMKSLCREK